MRAPAGATLAEAVGTAGGAASPADVSIANGVTGVADTLLAADGSRFLRLTSDFFASPSSNDTSSGSNSSGNNSTSSSAFGGPGVAQALCELKPAAPTNNNSQQAQQQQSPRQLSLSFFARASLCAEGEGGAEGEAERLLKVLLLAVPLNASAAAAAWEGAGEQVWGEWRVGVPCGGSSASLSGALPWFQGLGGDGLQGGIETQVSEKGREVRSADPSPLKSFSHWPLSSSHPLLTAGSTRRNPSSLSLTTLSDRHAVSLALHPAPFALLAPATPSSPCRPFSFSTSFAFRISSPNAAGLGGEGLAFVMLPSPTLGLPGPSLGYGRLLLPPGSTTGTDDSGSTSAVSSQQHRSLAVEFDTSSSPEFFDRPDHHVGVNLHGSMLSLSSAPVHPLGIPSLNAGQTLLATIQYNASSSQLTLWLSPAPLSPSLSRSSGRPPRFPRFPRFPGFPLSPRPSSSSSSTSCSASASSSASPSPPLPRSAVLTTFLDTCEWLGGNDPDAAALPPPLFVGFTAATGKGAEQAQAHEVLGWRFQVGEAAEDPLPFWAADSFSFPYITPATPLLTRGSTRKRFFAADLSVSADLFVGFTSAALPPPPGRLPSPVALSSWTFRFTDTDPCKGSPVLPCGMGACSKAPAPWDPSILLPSCKCPFNLPSFEPSHLSGLPSCFPGETWSAVGKVWSAIGARWSAVGARWSAVGARWSAVGARWSAVGERWSAVGALLVYSFTCAPGVCMDDVDGSYTCLCPSPFFPFYFFPKGTARCYLLRSTEIRVPTFLSPYGLTCPLILNTYGLTQADFLSQNKGFQCRAPIPVDTLVNVTSRAFSQCTAMYSANYGDTCDSINALFSTQIQPLNPSLSCSDGPRLGQLLCVDFNQTWLELGNTRLTCNLFAQITPTAATPSPQPPPPLANYTSQGVLVTVLQGPQTCQQLWRAFGIASPTRFFQMNPGLSCDSLLPHSPLQGNMMSMVSRKA
ncbi:unnamed protein product [Closterium sp. Naga37s-1]|nr:unnamed protein product [Closterium sp. Naga37s-1]